MLVRPHSRPVLVYPHAQNVTGTRGVSMSLMTDCRGQLAHRDCVCVSVRACARSEPIPYPAHVVGLFFARVYMRVFAACRMSRWSDPGIQTRGLDGFGRHWRARTHARTYVNNNEIDYS